MKKLLALLLAGAMALSMAACGSSEPAASEGGTTETAGKVAIITNTVSQNEEEYRSAELMTAKYGDRIVHVTWPDNFMAEQEQMITTVSKLAADPDIKAIVINQAVPGTNPAIDKLLETRDDMFIVYATPQENPEDVAVRADIIMQPNELDMGPAMVELAYEMGAKTFVHYSFPRHMAQIMLSGRRDLMMAKCEELGIQFVDATAPDPTGDSGTAGAQQFILEDVPKMVAQYGKDTAFFSTNCAMQVPLIKACVEQGAMYPQPCCPSPYHGYPTALGLVAEGDSAAAITVEEIVAQTTAALDAAGVLGRFGTWPVPTSMMMTVAGTEYAIDWIDGEITDRLDVDALTTRMGEYAGRECAVSPYVDEAGTSYDNYLLIMMDYLVYE